MTAIQSPLLNKYNLKTVARNHDMHFTLNLSSGEYLDYHILARTAEESGWYGISTPDSLFATKATASDYPYADTDAIRAYIEASPFIEPMVAMTWLASATSKLHFYPAVMKVPVRQPLVLAKMYASLAVLSNNRVSIGAGLSPWREDFAYNGVDFDKRGKLMDECIAIIRGATSGEWFEHHGENYDFGPIKMSPVPSRPIPILIGGHAKAALNRAARSGDGWIAANSDPEALAVMIKQLNELRAQHGTADRDDFQIHVTMPPSDDLDGYRRLGELGITHIYTAPFANPHASIDVRLDDMKRFAEKVVQPLQ